MVESCVKKEEFGLKGENEEDTSSNPSIPLGFGSILKRNENAKGHVILEEESKSSLLIQNKGNYGGAY